MNAGPQYAHQVVVPAYVWADVEQRKALLVHIGAMMRRHGQQTGEPVDVDNATVTPHGMTATVGHATIAEGAEPTAFVAYDQCSVEHADLVLVVVTASVILS